MVGDNSKKFTTNEESSVDGSACYAAKGDSNNNASTFEKPIRCFYFVKYPTYDDPQLMLEIDQAEEELRKLWQARIQIGQELGTKERERVMLIDQIKLLTLKDKKPQRKILNRKIQDKMRIAPILYYNKPDGLGPAKQELNDSICSLRHRMQHQSNNLVSENNILREIQEIEGAREKVKADEKMETERDYISNQCRDFYINFSRNKSIEARNKLMDDHATSMKIVRDTTEQKIRSLKEAMKPLKSLISEAYGSVVLLRKEHDRAKAYRIVMAKAGEYAANKEVKALEELCKSEMENFMWQWNSSTIFREDYKKMNLPSRDRGH